MYKPVSQKGTDEVLGVLRHLHIIGEDEGVLVVHDLPVRSHQGLGIKRSLACESRPNVNLRVGSVFTALPFRL